MSASPSSVAAKVEALEVYVPLNKLEEGVLSTVKVMVCRKWDSLNSYGKYLSTEYIFSDCEAQNDGVVVEEVFTPLAMLEEGGGGAVKVLVCRKWDSKNSFGKYLSTEFILSDSEVGHTVHIAGLMRVDIEESSVDTVYLTVWASPHLPLHMGKTDTADRMLGVWSTTAGENRVKELGEWVKKEFPVTGNSRDSSSVDVAVGGLGWVAIGLKGEATLGVWTYDGIQVVLRNSLLPYRSWDFELAGFTVSKIVSQADQSLNKSRLQAEKRKRSAKQQPELEAIEMPTVSSF